jgi:hypothetical protein
LSSRKTSTCPVDGVGRFDWLPIISKREGCLEGKIKKGGDTKNRYQENSALFGFYQIMIIFFLVWAFGLSMSEGCLTQTIQKT